MTNQHEYFDTLADTQKKVFENLLNVQQDLRVQWIAAILKTQAAFTNIPGLPETPLTKEALNQFNTWLSTVANNSQNATGEALRTQQYWISVYERQLAISRDVLKNFIDIASSSKTK
jgi:hypothetical protein